MAKATKKGSSKRERVIIFDTTLRDGEQSPGATMTPEEKLRVAEVLDQMGVDVIEAGFAIASDGDFYAINEIAKVAKNATICSLARCKPIDIERAAEAVKPARRGRIHTFVSTSPIHLKYQMKMSEAQVLELIADCVKLARRRCDDVEWSAMDATRSDIDFLCRAIELAIKSGATTINIPDTVGYALPQDYHRIIGAVKNRVPNIDKVIISVHCQNDLGLATANSLAAVEAGARQIECTINGIGERAGNTSLEEVVMAIKTRQDLLNFDMGVKTEYIMRASKLVQNITGFSIQPNKAIVGANAFAHESGIHQDGVLKHASTYEIMTPESVGLVRKTSLVMGKHSGRHAFKDKLKELGLTLGDSAFEDAFNRFKALADKKKTVYDDDIIALVDDTAGKGDERVTLKKLKVVCGSEGKAKAELSLTVDGKVKSAKTEGDGPVDASFKAIRAIVAHKARLTLYQVHAVTKGIDAQAEVTVRLETDKGIIINGNGADTDTMVASTQAYIAALNKLLSYEEKLVPERAALATENKITKHKQRNVKR
jgi:2-isopropylmalate synthase